MTPEFALAVRDAGEGRSSAVQSGNTQEDLELKSPELEDWESKCSELAGGQAGKETIQRPKRRKTEIVCRLLCQGSIVNDQNLMLARQVPPV